MPTECSQDSFDFGTVEGRGVIASFDGGSITSDAGALLVGQTNKAICLTKQFAACFTDARLPEATTHSVETMIGQIVFGHCLGYEDLVDHDLLRHDPVLAVLAWQAAVAAQDLRAAGAQVDAQSSTAVAEEPDDALLQDRA